ncbi:MAG TPA: phosphatase PAP2 family protein [Longimicrobiales bacterium]
MSARSEPAMPSLGAWLVRLPWPLLAGGWTLAYLTGLAFGLILHLEGWWEHGAAWERAMLVAVNETVSPTLDIIMLWLPLVGTNYSLAPIVTIAVVWLWRRGRHTAALHLAVVQAGSWVLNPAIKFTIPRPRPDLFELRGQYAFPAYPSGHSIAVVSVLFTVAYLIHRAGHGTWAYVVVAAFYVLNSYSRIYLAVHWPTDVIGGTIVGAIWLAVTMAAFRTVHGPRMP